MPNEMRTATLYPSYKDFDSFIDVARLKSLDNYIRERLQRRGSGRMDPNFYTGPFTLGQDAPKLPGSQMVYLSRSERPDDYYDLDRTELWQPTTDALDFPELMSFLATLPFAATGRMLIMYDESGRAVTAHRDHDSADLCHEFIWLRTNLDKPFYILSADTGEKRYVTGHSAWFDAVNQFHGADAGSGLTWSIRVDGRFSDAFRKKMPRAPAANLACLPALWEAEPSPPEPPNWAHRPEPA